MTTILETVKQGGATCTGLTGGPENVGGGALVRKASQREPGRRFCSLQAPTFCKHLYHFIILIIWSIIITFFANTKRVSVLFGGAWVLLKNCLQAGSNGYSTVYTGLQGKANVACGDFL